MSMTRAPAAQRQPDAFAGEIVRRRGALEHLGHATGAQDHRAALECNRRRRRHVEADCAHRFAVAHHDVGDGDVAQSPDAGVAAGLVAQRSADRYAGAQEVDIDAALAIVARRLDLVDLAVVAARPVDVPVGQLAYSLGAALAQQRGQVLVAEAAPRARACPPDAAWGCPAPPSRVPKRRSSAP